MNKNDKKALGVAAVTGAAVAAYYLLYGSKNAAKNRTAVQSWAQAAEKEIVARTKKIKQAALSDENVRKVIQEVAARYEKAKKLDGKDVRAFVASMQKGISAAHKAVMKEAKAAASNVKKQAQKKGAAKTAKKAAKKKSKA